MNSQTRRFLIPGPVGAIEVLEDLPTLAPGELLRGVAVIAHPHPLFAGTMDNKVVQTLARACVQCGWRALRFNFRGVGGTHGAHDGGRGELHDLMAVIDYGGQASAPATTGLVNAGGEAPLVLAGFSFGAFVASHAIAALGAQRAPQHIVLVGTATTRFDVAPVPQALHNRTLVIHAEGDDTVPLSHVMDWARPQTLPVTVVPGGSHFFHGQLPLLRGLVERHLGVVLSAVSSP